MKIIKEIDSYRGFEFYGSAVSRWEKIVEEHKEDEFYNLVDEVFNGKVSDAELNKWLIFNDDKIMGLLDIEWDN